MKRNVSPRLRTNSILGSLFVLILILFSTVPYAQSPVDFSGVWIQDTSTDIIPGGLMLKQVFNKKQ